MDWAYFVLGVVAYQFLRVLALSINRAIIEHRQKKFLKVLDIRFPERKTVTLISIDSSDKRAMARLERQFREQYELDDPPVIKYRSKTNPN